jgi:hypothetical protein
VVRIRTGQGEQSVTANFLLRDEKLFRDAQKDSAPLLHQQT